MLDNLMENPEHVLNFFANPSCKNHQVVVPSVPNFLNAFALKKIGTGRYVLM